MEEALVKRILPHSIEAEKAVIGSMIMDADAIATASDDYPAMIFISGSTACSLMRWSS